MTTLKPGDWATYAPDSLDNVTGPWVARIGRTFLVCANRDPHPVTCTCPLSLDGTVTDPACPEHGRMAEAFTEPPF